MMGGEDPNSFKKLRTSAPEVLPIRNYLTVITPTTPLHAIVFLLLHAIASFSTTTYGFNDAIGTFYIAGDQLYERGKVALLRD